MWPTTSMRVYGLPPASVMGCVPDCDGFASIHCPAAMSKTSSAPGPVGAYQLARSSFWQAMNRRSPRASIHAVSGRPSVSAKAAVE